MSSQHSRLSQFSNQLHCFSSHLTLVSLLNLKPRLSLKSQLLSLSQVSTLKIQKDKKQYSDTHTRGWTHTHTLEKKLKKAAVMPPDAANPFCPQSPLPTPTESAVTAYISIAPCLHITKFLQAPSEPGKWQPEFWLLTLGFGSLEPLTVML